MAKETIVHYLWCGYGLVNHYDYTSLRDYMIIGITSILKHLNCDRKLHVSRYDSNLQFFFKTSL